jgi:hypothetical protein
MLDACSQRRLAGSASFARKTTIQARLTAGPVGWDSTR